MSPFTIVIPSRTLSNLLPCIGAIRRAGEPAPVVVVWDAPKPGERALADFMGIQAALSGMATVIQAIKPFIYARNCNLGIAVAGGDVVLLNDDALLVSPRGFTVLSEAAAAHPEYGVIGCTTEHAGNPNQWPVRPTVPRTIPNFAPGKMEIPELQPPGLRDEPYMVCFVAAYIPKRTIEAVGLLDERFIHYGYEDLDYCVRIRRAGLKIGIHDGCFVDHGSLVSTFRGAANAGGDLAPNHGLFVAKWGSVNV